MTRTPTTPLVLCSSAALSLLLCTGVAGASSGGEVVSGVAPALSAPSAHAAPAVEGRVVRAGSPVPEVLVYAFEVASRKLEKVSSDGQGRFLFDRLPAGMYKLVAFKPGFVPAIELLLRRSPTDGQFVEMQLQEATTGDVRDGEHYWSVRGRVPADVLRDMQGIELASRISSRSGFGDRLGQPAFQLQHSEAFEAEMRALGGVEGFGGSRVQSTTAEVGLRGAVGSVQLGVDGTIQQLSSVDRSYSDGEVRTMTLQMAASEDQHLRLATSQSQLAALSAAGIQPVDMRRYQVDWSGRAGDEGETRVSASYVEESNYHRSGGLEPAAVPGASQTWDLSGSYNGTFGKTAIDTGLTYRQRSLLGDLNTDSDHVLDEQIGIYGIAGMQIVPRVLVEYGLFSSVRDGSLSLMPHGGVVVELGSGWKGGASAAQRVEDGHDLDSYQGFDTAFFNDESSCRRSGEACYEVFLSHSSRDDQEITLGAVQRQYAETLRVYFSPDFFDRLESLFVVEGDRVPEFQFSMMRRITPKVLAKLESNYASGGGGIFYATDNAAYENQVRYLVTSLDTQFQQTSTGVFVAFHHLEQSLNPLATEQAQQGDAKNGVEVQRLQLMLTQDLSALVDMATRWAVRLNMEVSRGATPYTLTHDDEMYKKLSGGISVSF
ncbi:MAG: carboxypeptidase-like regulatory domain-containing protein [Thermoanaerobaculia bacterium]|nr:carboxypeptidase-like regulatory domain-containing protein [Thermoanaerobaculia bacterium]